MYKKPLQRKKDGSFERWLGVDGNGVKQVFRMPAAISQDEADKRWREIEALWQMIESEVIAPDCPIQKLDQPISAFWDEERLETAKAIAKGKPATMNRRMGETSAGYVKRILKTQAILESELIPNDKGSYETGIEHLRALIIQTNEQYGTAVGTPGVQLTGITLATAFAAYEEDIKTRRKYQTSEGKRKPWAKTQLDNIASMTGFYLKEFMNLDLGELNLCKCEQMIEVFAARPMTQRDTPLKISSARHFIKQLRSFFRWLNKSETLTWDMPRKLDLTAHIEFRKLDVQEKERQRAENQTIGHDHLKVIAEYGTPLERLYVFLALNCAYGADQLGRLQTTWLDLEKAMIDGERMKSETISRHSLWKVSVEGLKWYLSKHNRKGLIFIASGGNPVYHETANGNVIDGFGNRWDDLMKRIRKDKGDEFPKYSFGKLRKTAATEILRVADPHIASMLLAHQTISDDELLRRYANLHWEDLFNAQRKLEEELRPIFEAAGSDPFGIKPKTYIGVEKTKAIFELYELGNTAQAIAEQLGTTASTVYRHLMARYGKNRTKPLKRNDRSE